jgi:hypothetical protein
MKYLKIVLTVCLLIVFLSGCNLITLKEPFSREIGLGSIKEIYVQTKNGSISVLGMDTSLIYVSGEKHVQGLGNLSEEIQKINITYEIVNDALIIKVDAPSSSNFLTRSSYGANFDIKVPASLLSAIYADTSNGSIKVGDVESKLRLNSSNGTIDLSRVKGTVDVATSNGAILFYHVQLIEGTHSAVTSNGRIEGDVAFPVNGSCRLRTSNGAIRLNVPTASSLNFRAETSNGGISYSNLPVVLNQTGKTRQSGTLREGTFLLDIVTSNGGIHMEGVPAW